jgi:hypothetical protein
MTKTPKVLPWIARKAGISDEQAEALWREAVCQSTLQIGRVGNSDYYRAVVERLHELVEREKAVALAGQPLPSSRLLLRHRPSDGNDTVVIQSLTVGITGPGASCWTTVAP